MDIRDKQFKVISDTLRLSPNIVQIILVYMADEVSTLEVAELSLEELEAESKIRDTTKPIEVKYSTLAWPSERGELYNPGLQRWNQVRSEWIRGGKAKFFVSKKRRKRVASTSSESSSDEDSDVSDGSENDYVSEAPNVEIPVIMNCLRNQKPFPSRISLAHMVDVLTVLWDDESLAS